MGNNASPQSVEIEDLRIIVHAHDKAIAALMVKNLVLAGCENVDEYHEAADTIEAIDRISPSLIIIIANLNIAEELEAALQINKKRAITKQRTPKILGMIKPTPKDILKAKKANFFDIIPLPQSPIALANRIQTVVSRFN